MRVLSFGVEQELLWVGADVLSETSSNNAMLHRLSTMPKEERGNSVRGSLVGHSAVNLCVSCEHLVEGCGAGDVENGVAQHDEDMSETLSSWVCDSVGLRLGMKLAKYISHKVAVTFGAEALDGVLMQV